MIVYKCKYCGKEINNKGCLVLHEKYCEKNPNRTISKTQSIREERNSRRDEFGNIKVRKKFHHSEETKKILSEKRKQWLSKNKDKHPWKNNDKFISKPCEQLKEWLREQNINFVEEYEPFEDYHYCLDIAWPDEKIAIEINGNQHYTNDGNLKPYYQKRHDLFTERGWNIFEIPYNCCYNLNREKFDYLFKLPIYNKNYIGYTSKKNLSKKEKQQKRKEKEIINKSIVFDLITSEDIDFSRRGWSKPAQQYLKSRNSEWNNGVFRIIRRYYPDFLSSDKVWKRKGSKL